MAIFMLANLILSITNKKLSAAGLLEKKVEEIQQGDTVQSCHPTLIFLKDRASLLENLCTYFSF